MNEAEARNAGYCRWSPGERQRLERPLQEAIAELRRLLPMGARRFERLLGAGLADAVRHDTGFYLGGFAARRALGSELLVDIDPFLLTHQLDHRIQHGGRAYSIRDSFLGAGDWRPLLHALTRSITHREIVDIVDAGYEYRDTRWYRRALARAATPRPVSRNYVGLSSPDKVDSYFRQAAEMCRSIERSGLMRRRDYGRRLSSFATPMVRLPWIELGEVDIGIAIGPEGELYRFASGKHRTAAAQALKLTSIPVEIRMVHAGWLARHMETGLTPLAALRNGIKALAQAKPGAR